MNTDKLKVAFMNIVSPANTHKIEECVEKMFNQNGEKDQDDRTVINYDKTVSIASTLNNLLSQYSIGEGIEWTVKDYSESFTYKGLIYDDNHVEINEVKMIDEEQTSINAVVIYDDEAIYNVISFDYEHFVSGLNKVMSMYYPLKKKGYP